MCRRLIALFCVLTSLHVEAGYDTGNRLFEDCNSDNYFNRGYCGGYVVGVVDTMEAMQASGLVPKNALCIPGGATKGQLADTVRQYLADHPERRHRDSGSLVPEALKAAFPCGK